MGATSILYAGLPIIEPDIAAPGERTLSTAEMGSIIAGRVG